MELRKIVIENFRAFKHFSCEFDAGVNLVIGDNGAGKTSLLTAIAQLLSVQVGRFGGGLGVDPADPHLEVSQAGDATLSIKECFPITMSGKIVNDNGIMHDFGIIRKDYNNSGSNGERDLIANIAAKEDSIWPLISYQRFDREWKLGKNGRNSVEVETGFNERRDGYRECLSGIGQDAKIQKWCLKMSMMEYERKDVIKEFERFKYIIKAFLQSIEDMEADFEVSYSMGFSGLVLKRGDATQPLYDLSTGYKAILSMIMELAYRSVLLNPAMEKEDLDQSGIVIIDEIDAHLHPKWQWRVIDALRKCFPNVQFIIATHSPIVISSAKDARIVCLEAGEQVSYSDDAYGFNVADVLELKQGSKAKPKVSEEYMDRLEKAFDEGDIGAAEGIVSDARNEFGAGSHAYRELKGYLDINRWVENS